MFNYENHKTPIKNGLIWGAISIATILVLYLVGMLENVAGNILLFLFGLYMMYQSGVSKRNDLGGFISWKQSLTPIWLTSIVSSLLSIPFTWIMYKFIDPGLQEKQKEEAVKMIERMRGWIGDAAAEAELEKLETQDFASPGQYLLVFFGAIVFYFFISCLIALIVKRKDPSTIFTKY
ncbi:MAG: DUF4199 domain-containing protein [Saprospiraceae bacterium]|nr:DUF4199 domain-containing protein [Saprospiraceae bacterium]